MRLPKIKYPYYYVPPCPHCGSRKTGRYVREPLYRPEYVKEDSLKHGEWIRFLDSIPRDNVFCLSCGNEWPAKISLKLMTQKEIQDEKDARETEGFYLQMTGKDNADHSEQDEVQEADIIDRRKRDRIELFYADEELIRKLKDAKARL